MRGSASGDLQVYPLYKAATGQGVVKEELGRIVAEEQRHRRSIEEICSEALGAAGTDLSRPQAIEVALFESLLAALEQEVGLAVSERPPRPGDQFRDGYTPPRQIT